MPKNIEACKLNARPGAEALNFFGSLKRALFHGDASSAAPKGARELFVFANPALTRWLGCCAAHAPLDSDYETVLERSKNSSTPQEKVRHQKLLGIFPGSKQMKRTLEMCVNGEVPAQDAPHLVALCLRNRSQSVQVWQFIKDNWEYMNRYYPPISIAPLLAGVTTLDRPEQVDDVLEFFKTHDVPQGRPMMRQHLERLRINAAFRKREALCLSNALITKQCGFAIIKCSP